MTTQPSLRALPTSIDDTAALLRDGNYVAERSLATAEYRAHLVNVLARRAVQQALGKN